MASMFDFTTKSLDGLKEEFENKKEDAVKATAVAEEAYRLLVLALGQDERENENEFHMPGVDQADLDGVFDAFDWGSENSRPVTPLHNEVMAKSSGRGTRGRKPTPDAIVDTGKVPMSFSRVVRDEIDRSTFYVTWYERSSIYGWVRTYPRADFHTLQRRELFHYFAIDAPLDLPLVIL